MYLRDTLKALISVSDKAQLEFALSQKRVIFTQDTDFLRMHLTLCQNAQIALKFSSYFSLNQGWISLHQSLAKVERQVKCFLSLHRTNPDENFLVQILAVPHPEILRFL